VRATRDTLLDNNSDSGLVFTSGKPRVLLIESDPKLAKNLAWAMEQEDIQVEVRPPQGMPESLADLQNYELLALSNVPATALTSRQMEVARTYVQDLGGGFIMIGGDQSFGLGGYYKTVIEEILPVRSDFEKEKEKPSLAIMLVLDKSGSMGGQKIELAKDAAKAAVELLGPNDKIGVIVFDGDPYSICEIHSATDKSYILDRIASIEAGGGTNLAPAMQEAFIALHGAFAKLKHVIILSDGISAPGDFEGIAQNMAADRITITTVGVGQDADQNMLEQLAKIGSGRCYITTDPKSVPQIFAKETVTASKSAIHEEPFLAQVIRSTPVLADIDFESAPYLLGYVVTRPKPTCEFILATEQGDPLLAWWRFGLGMAVAFTSDAKSRWAAEWVSWRDYGKFWAQLIRNTMRKSEAKGVVVEMKESKSRGRNDAPDQAKGESPRSIHTVTLDSVDSSGKYLNKAETEMTVIDPQLGTLKVPMIQAAPGRYAAEIDTSRSGAYHIELTQKIGGRVLYRQSRGLMVGYPDELRLRPTNEQLLKSIATVSGGTYDPEPQRVFEPTDRTVSRASPLWPYLVVAAALVLLADVALRRIDLSLVPSALSPLVFRVAKGWLGLSPRSPGRGIEDKVRV
jgi:uncharacterized membrane protein